MTLIYHVDDISRSLLESPKISILSTLCVPGICVPGIHVKSVSVSLVCPVSFSIKIYFIYIYIY